MSEINNISVLWVILAFAVGFCLPLIFYLVVVLMTESSLRRLLCEIIDILIDVRSSTTRTFFLLEKSVELLMKKTNGGDCTRVPSTFDDGAVNLTFSDCPEPSKSGSYPPYGES